MQKEVIVVDEYDRIVGIESVGTAHSGDGLLHRAVSVFLFDERGQLLLQRRSQSKPLWPGFWSNSCCTHPAPGESYLQAAERRVHEELGVRVAVAPVFTFLYRASYKTIGVEYEMCRVFVGYLNKPPHPNRQEVDDLMYLSCLELSKQVDRNTQRFTPWFVLEWKKMERLQCVRRLPLSHTQISD